MGKHMNALKKFVLGLQGMFADDKTDEAVLTVSLKENDLRRIPDMRPNGFGLQWLRNQN